MLHKIFIVIFGFICLLAIFPAFRAMWWLNYPNGKHPMYWDGSRATIRMSWWSMYAFVAFVICLYVLVAIGKGFRLTGFMLAVLLACWLRDKGEAEK
jgi:hypothetical protein